MSDQLTRRKFLKGLAIVAGSSALASCAPKIVKETVIIEKPVKETVIVEGTPQVVEKVVTVTPAPAAVEVVELIVAKGDSVYQPMIQDAPARVALEEAVGVRMIVQAAPQADWNTKMSLMLATNQVPDIMQVSGSAIADYAKPSVLHPIRALAEEYAPNIKKYNEANSYVKRFVQSGELYLLLRDGYNKRVVAPMPMVRKDLLEKLDLPAPDDFDQLYEVLKEFKKYNPDAICWGARRGLKRFLMINAYPMGSGMGAWKTGVDIPYYDKDVDGGKWLYGPIHPEFRDVLDYFARLYKEGLLDPDITTTNDDQLYERYTSDRAIFIWENMTFPVRWNKALREKNPEATWGPIPVLRGKKGRRQNNYNGPSGGYVIGAGCKHPDRVIQLYNFQISPEGLDLTNWGIEDVHYTLKGSRPDVIEDYTLEGIGKAMPGEMREIVPGVFEKYAKTPDPYRKFQSDVGLGQLDWVMLYDQTVHYIWDEPGEADAWYELTAKDPGLHDTTFAPPFNADEAERLKDIQADVDAIVNPALERVVLGQMSLSEYDKAVQDMINAGAEEWERIYNEAEARL